MSEFETAVADSPSEAKQQLIELEDALTGLRDLFNHPMLGLSLASAAEKHVVLDAVQRAYSHLYGNDAVVFDLFESRFSELREAPADAVWIVHTAQGSGNTLSVRVALAFNGPNGPVMLEFDRDRREANLDFREPWLDKQSQLNYAVGVKLDGWTSTDTPRPNDPVSRVANRLSEIAPHHDVEQLTAAYKLMMYGDENKTPSLNLLLPRASFVSEATPELKAVLGIDTPNRWVPYYPPAAMIIAHLADCADAAPWRSPRTVAEAREGARRVVPNIENFLKKLPTLSESALTREAESFLSSLALLIPWAIQPPPRITSSRSPQDGINAMDAWQKPGAPALAMGLDVKDQELHIYLSIQDVRSKHGTIHLVFSLPEANAPSGIPVSARLLFDDPRARAVPIKAWIEWQLGGHSLASDLLYLTQMRV